MGNQHIHHNEIKAWADGETIQYFNTVAKQWYERGNPTWDADVQYRVKPSHPHQALMDEYAGGCIQLEIYNKYTDSWAYIDNPCWDIDLKYRIREYDVGTFYHADYIGYSGIALRCNTGWKFIAPGYTGALYVFSITILNKIVD